jgi:hypothetical protein
MLVRNEKQVLQDLISPKIGIIHKLSILLPQNKLFLIFHDNNAHYAS